MHKKNLLRIALGSALALASTAVYANLLTNGSFETGDLTGWTATGDYNIVVLDSNAESGSYDLAMGDTSTTFPYGTVSQTVSTVANQTYLLTYWFESDGQTPNYFDASWDGNIIAGSVLTNSPISSWVEYSFNVVGTGSDTLLFNQQDYPGFLRLDNVSLTATDPVPEPSEIAVMGVGLIGLAGMRRRANKRRKA